ncbi:hypothetical protein HDV00_007280 [Rhizophlyctis rosea]|nr:hypothetical protein HDV00_007280 [Rhizophlyctis rosea]
MAHRRTRPPDLPDTFEDFLAESESDSSTDSLPSTPKRGASRPKSAGSASARSTSRLSALSKALESSRSSSPSNTRPASAVSSVRGSASKSAPSKLLDFLSSDEDSDERGSIQSKELRIEELRNRRVDRRRGGSAKRGKSKTARHEGSHDESDLSDRNEDVANSPAAKWLKPPIPSTSPAKDDRPEHDASSSTAARMQADRENSAPPHDASKTNKPPPLLLRSSFGNLVEDEPSPNLSENQHESENAPVTEDISSESSISLSLDDTTDDKRKFFQQLGLKDDDDVDYGALNRQLSEDEDAMFDQSLGKLIEGYPPVLPSNLSGQDAEQGDEGEERDVLKDRATEGERDAVEDKAVSQKRDREEEEQEERDVVSEEVKPRTGDIALDADESTFDYPSAQWPSFDAGRDLVSSEDKDDQIRREVDATTADDYSVDFESEGEENEGVGEDGARQMRSEASVAEREAGNREEGGPQDVNVFDPAIQVRDDSQSVSKGPDVVGGVDKEPSGVSVDTVDESSPHDQSGESEMEATPNLESVVAGTFSEDLTGAPTVTVPTLALGGHLTGTVSEKPEVRPLAVDTAPSDVAPSSQFSQRASSYQTFSDFMTMHGGEEKEDSRPSVPVKAKERPKSRPVTKTSQNKPPSPSPSKIPRRKSQTFISTFSRPSTVGAPTASSAARQAALRRVNEKFSASSKPPFRPAGKTPLPDVTELGLPPRSPIRSSPLPTHSAGEPFRGVGELGGISVMFSPMRDASATQSAVHEAPSIQKTNVENMALKEELKASLEVVALRTREMEQLREDVAVLEQAREDDKEEMKRREEEWEFERAQRNQNKFEGVEGDALQRVQREIGEQEILIKGYQKENEKLVEEVKSLKKGVREGERVWQLKYEEILRENTGLRNQVRDLSLRVSGGGGAARGGRERDLGAAKIAIRCEKLEGLVREGKAREEALEAEIGKLRALVEDKDGQLEELRGADPEMVRELREGWRKERERFEGYVVELEGRVRTFEEEREVLAEREEVVAERERDVERLLQGDVGGRPGAVVRRGGNAIGGMVGGVGEGKKVKLLEKQVRELERALERKAGGAAGGAKDKPVIEESVYVRHLREKVRRLEQEVEVARREGEKMVKSLQLEFASEREQYEQRILALTTSASEREIAAAMRAQEAANVRIAALEKQISDLLSAYSDRIRVGDPSLPAAYITTSTTTDAATRNLQEAEIATLREREGSLRRRILELEGMVEMLTKRIDESRKEKDALESSLRAKLKDRDAVIESYETKITKLQQEVLDKVFAAEEARAVEEARKWKVESEKWRRECEELKRRLEISEGLRRGVSESLGVLVGKAQEEGARMAVGWHERVIEGLRREILEWSELQAEVKRLEAKVRELEVECLQWKERYRDMEETWKEERGKLEGTLVEVRKENVQLKAIVEDGKRGWPPPLKRFEELGVRIVELEERARRREREIAQMVRMQQKGVGNAGGMVGMGKRDEKGAVEEAVKRERMRLMMIIEKKDREIEEFRREMERVVEGIGELRRQGVLL